LRRLAADQYLRSGRIAEGLDALGPVLATVGMKVPASRGQALRTFVWERLRLKLRGFRVQRRDEREVPPELIRKIEVCFTMFPFGMTDTLRGHPFQMRNLRLSLDAGVPARIVRAIVPELVFACTLGERKSAHADRCCSSPRLAAEVGDPYLSGAVAAAACAGHSLLGRFRSCRDRGDASVRTFREQCVGVAWELDTALLYGIRGTSISASSPRSGIGCRARSRRRPSAATSTCRPTSGSASRWHTCAWPMTIQTPADGSRARRWRPSATRTPTCSTSTTCRAWSRSTSTRATPRVALRRMTEWWPRIAKAMYLRIELTRLITRHLRARIHLTAAEQASGTERERHLVAAAADARRIIKERVSWATPLGTLLEAGVAAARGDAPTAAAQLAASEAGLWAPRWACSPRRPAVSAADCSVAAKAPR
jgi:hypothetical protein